MNYLITQGVASLAYLFDLSLPATIMQMKTASENQINKDCLQFTFVL